MTRDQVIYHLRKAHMFAGMTSPVTGKAWGWFPVGAIHKGDEWHTLRKRGLVAIESIHLHERGLGRRGKHAGHKVTLTDKGRDYLNRFGGGI